MAVSKRTSKPKAEKTTKAKSENKATAPQAAAPAKITTRAVDIGEAIRFRAYQLFEQRGYGHGADLEDWLRAESEVLGQFGARTA
jgi:Protein of unknown function (DUF2934)